jgi:hypothetical protein
VNAGLGAGSLRGLRASAIALPARSPVRGQYVAHIRQLLPVAVLYFFFNGAGLPTGLFYTSMLAPLFFLWLLGHGKRWMTFKLLACLSPFVIAHAFNGIESSYYYARSSLLLWTVCITVYAFSLALLKCESIGRLFEQLIVLNFCAAMIALVVLFTRFREVLWNDYSDSFEEGSSQVLRLKLLTSEPSVYAFLMAPLLVFVILRLLHNPGKRNLLYAVMIAIPFLLCQSFGGLSISLAGIGVAVLVAFRNVLKQRRAWLVLAVMVVLVAALVYVPNPISERLSLVATGKDSSTDSRTVSSFIVAYNIAEPKSLLWGAGLGQAKLADVTDLRLGFTIGVIPNAIAGGFAELGIIGMLIKFALEFYFFFRTRVYENSFRLAMFVVVFLTQLTGSYLMNVQEYLMWVLAFGPFLPELDFKANIRPKLSHA